MLGLAPIAAAPLADDKKPLLRIQVSTLGAVALEGTSQARASTDGVSLVVMSPLRGAAGTFSKINAHSAGGFDMAGHAAAIGPLKVVAAEGFAVVTGATAGLETRVASDGSIALAAQGDARARSFGVVLSGLELRGAAAAKGTTAASGLGFVDMSGRTGGQGILQTSAAGSITLARQLVAEGGVEGAAVRGMAFKGATNGIGKANGTSAGSFRLGVRASAAAIQSGAANGAMDLGGSGQGQTVSASRTASFGPMLSGFAIGTTLEARFADITGRLGLGVSASAAVEAHAIADAVFAGSMEALGNVSTCSAITGGLSLAQELGANVLATGETDREIGLAGKARAAAVTAADAPAVGMELTGTSAAQGASFGSVRYELPISGSAELASSVFAGASAAFTLNLDALIANGVGAVGTAQVPMRGASRFVTDVAAVAADCLGLFGYGAGDVLPDARLGGQFGIAGGATGGIASLGQGRGTLDVVRDFTGDVDVFGDSARQISLRGTASARSTSTGERSNPVVEVTGAASARATAAVETAANVALPCSAKAGVPAAATTSFSIDWITEAAATATRSVQSRGTLSLVGRGQVRSAVVGTATADTLAIESRLGGQTGVAARLNAWPDLEGSARARIGTDARGAGQVSVARNSDANVRVAGNAARLLPLVGTAAGALVARATRVDGTVALAGTANARAQTAASPPNGAPLDVQGHATGAAHAQCISSGRVAFVRLGQGDVLVAGGAARGIAFLRSAQAGNVAKAAANLPLAPGLAGSAATVIHLDFTAEAIAPGGRAAGSNLAHASEVSARWNLHLTSIAYRAPPALRRAETPKYGLSGRLSPSNSGRILRG